MAELFYSVLVAGAAMDCHALLALLFLQGAVMKATMKTSSRELFS
jgi:hypothetical protein